MKIAYGKLGRSFPLTRETCGAVGGDIEVANLLETLVREGHEVHLVGRNRADFELKGVTNHWAKGGIFDNCPVPTRCISDPEYQAFIAFLTAQSDLLPEFDAWVIWLGQHGSSLHCVPAVQDGMKGEFTQPLISLINYGYPIVHMVNQRKVRPLWLCPDPRNLIKMRDLYDPQQRTILAQFNDVKNNTFFDEPNNILRKGMTRYVYSGIEMLATDELDVIPESELTPENFSKRKLIGLMTNEGPIPRFNGRLALMQKWMGEYLATGRMTTNDIAGTWSEASITRLGRGPIRPIPNQTVNSWLSQYATTMTFPASSTGWATAKPWECFMAGVLCFKHPDYDSQNHIYSKTHMPLDLRIFLSPYNSEEYRRRVDSLTPETWSHWANLQRQYYLDTHERTKGGYAAIEEALNDH